MKQIFGPEGRRRLRASWVILAAAIVSAAGFVYGTTQYLQKEKRDAASGIRRLQEATARVEAIRRERDSLEHSIEVFRTLVERGVMQPERRLEVIELVNALRARHRIVSVDYEMAPQRPLALAGERGFPAIDIAASRVRLRFRALHEGDALAFVEALGSSDRGIHPVDRCQLRRIEAQSADALQPRVEGECTLEWITLREKRVA